MSIRDIEIKEAFCLFDTDADGRVRVCDLTVLLRSLGVNLSECDMEHLLQDRQEQDTLTYTEFLALAGDKLHAVNQEKQLLRAFRVFDKAGTGTIPASELKHVLLTLGSQLSVDDIDALLLLGMEGTGDELNYARFIQVLLRNPSPISMF